METKTVPGHLVTLGMCTIALFTVFIYFEGFQLFGALETFNSGKPSLLARWAFTLMLMASAWGVLYQILHHREEPRRWSLVLTTYIAFASAVLTVLSYAIGVLD